jgi:hypothetical protein
MWRYEDDGSMTEVVNKWDPPSIMDVDNEGFVAVREHLYQMLHELHMAEIHKLARPDNEYNVYWENFCDTVEHLEALVDSAVSNVRQDS